MGLQGRDFTIVFRSFGADVAEVVEEMNAFATGQHPSYPEVCALSMLGTCISCASAFLLKIAWLHQWYLPNMVSAFLKFTSVVRKCER